MPQDHSQATSDETRKKIKPLKPSKILKQLEAKKIAVEDKFSEILDCVQNIVQSQIINSQSVPTHNMNITEHSKNQKSERNVSMRSTSTIQSFSQRPNFRDPGPSGSGNQNNPLNITLSSSRNTTTCYNNECHAIKLSYINTLTSLYTINEEATELFKASLRIMDKNKTILTRALDEAKQGNKSSLTKVQSMVMENYDSEGVEQHQSDSEEESQFSENNFQPSTSKSPSNQPQSRVKFCQQSTSSGRK